MRGNQGNQEEEELYLDHKIRWKRAKACRVPEEVQSMMRARLLQLQVYLVGGKYQEIRREKTKQGYISKKQGANIKQSGVNIKKQGVNISKPWVNIKNKGYLLRPKGYISHPVAAGVRRRSSGVPEDLPIFINFPHFCLVNCKT